jgi:transcriptional regulator with XRE-family HTH domain
VTSATAQKTSRSFERTQLYRLLGIKIKIARDKRGFTQEEVAKGVGLSRTSLTNIEKGRQKLLLHTLIEIASVLNTTVVELLPDRSPLSEELNKRLPANLPLDERTFIEQTLSSRPSYENTTTNGNKTKGKPVASGKRGFGSTG